MPPQSFVYFWFSDWKIFRIETSGPPLFVDHNGPRMFPLENLFNHLPIPYDFFFPEKTTPVFPF